MKIINHISSSDIMAIDIETVRYTEHFSQLSEDWQSAWEYKNKNNGAIPNQEELAALWQDTSSLYAEFAKICAISVSFLHRGVLYCKNYVSEDEKVLLREVVKDLDKAFKNNPRLRLIGHASLFFDYPFIAKRLMVNGLDIPNWADESLKKPWEKWNLCTNELWRSFGTGAGSSLQALCTLFGIEISKVDLVGDGVGKAYFNKELLRIAEYCGRDAIATFNLFRAFKKEPLFLYKDVVFRDEGKILEAVPFLTAIHKSKVLTQEQAIAIDEFCQDLSGDEVNNVKLILEAALVNKKGVLAPEHQDFLEKL